MFTFYNKDKTVCVTFNPYYRSDISPEMTLAEIVKEGCENISASKNGKTFFEKE